MRFPEGARTAIGLLPIAMLATLSLRPAAVRAETPPEASEREAVLAVVQGFFDAMAARDVEAAQGLVVPEGRFHSVREVDGEPAIRTFTNQEFLDGLAGQKQSVRERMWDPEVRIRGRIATVWATYDFRVGGELSHCGVDAFDLIRTEEGWKISGGVYTVESECGESPPD